MIETRGARFQAAAGSRPGTKVGHERNATALGGYLYRLMAGATAQDMLAPQLVTFLEGV